MTISLIIFYQLLFFKGLLHIFSHPTRLAIVTWNFYAGDYISKICVSSTFQSLEMFSKPLFQFDVNITFLLVGWARKY